MKNFRNTLLIASIAFTTTAFSQIGDPDISDKWTLVDFKEYITLNEEKESITAKELEVTTEYTPVILDPEDKYKLNQDMIVMPTQVSKNIKLDFDDDKAYDKQVKFNYKKPKDYGLDFTLTQNGIIILSDKDNLHVTKIWDKKTKKRYSNSYKNRIKKEGDYIIKLSNGKKIDIQITDYNVF